VNNILPLITIMHMQNIFSLSVFPEMLPKPTVAMQVIVKYNAKTMRFNRYSLWRENRST